MKKKFRFIVYFLVGFPIPILSWILYPSFGWGGPVGWMAAVVVGMTYYELRIAYLKRKNK